MKAIFMARLTRPTTSLTTRKRASVTRLTLAGTVAFIAFGIAGCSTPGPTHAYLASRAEDPIIDLLPGSPTAEVPTFLDAVNELYGIAYDPFTDHIFIRSFPGDYIRVIDRPAHKIKRGFLVKGLPPGPGDLAIRSSDRHLFFSHPKRPEIVETTLYGEIIRTITLEDTATPPAGVAYDQKKDRLLILQSGSPARVDTYKLSGKRLGSVILDHDVRQVSLAYDSDKSEFYAPLRGQAAVGIFDSQGHLLRTLANPSASPFDYVDVGQRSLLRLF
jgi:hypothetical protein